MDRSADIHVRLASYNVEFGARGTAEEIGEMLRAYELDLIGFCEVPGGDWTARAGRRLGMDHAFVGEVSSANHRDKYKSLLSRTPLRNVGETVLAGDGWTPSSVVWAETEVRGLSILFGSLHICTSETREGSQAAALAREIAVRRATGAVVVMGDFNNRLGDAPLEALEECGMRAVWRDLPIDVSKESTCSTVERTDYGVIDQVFYGACPGARAADGGIIELERPLADHKPIWAELVFPA